MDLSKASGCISHDQLTAKFNSYSASFGMVIFQNSKQSLKIKKIYIWFLKNFILSLEYHKALY